MNRTRPNCAPPPGTLPAMNPGPALILVITGPHGSGKTRHAHRLTAALRARGVVAVSHHPGRPPSWCRNHWERAIHYAYERLRDLGSAPPGCVLVAARWDESTHLAATHAPPGMAEHLRDLAAYESTHRDAEVFRIFLDASEAALDARLNRRSGAPQTEEEKAEARELRRLRSPAEVINTEGPAAEVEAVVLDTALRIISSFELAGISVYRTPPGAMENNPHATPTPVDPRTNPEPGTETRAPAAAPDKIAYAIISPGPVDGDGRPEA